MSKGQQCIDKALDECAVGLLEINWEKRTVKISGLSGDAQHDMTPEKVRQALIRAKNKPLNSNKSAYSLVVWNLQDAGPGVFQNVQLCLYGLKDFEHEVYGPEER